MTKVQAKPTLSLPLGALEITRVQSASYTIPNVGSSLVIVLYDKTTKTAGLAHIALPDSNLQGAGGALDDPTNPAKFVDLGLPRLLHQFEAKGGQKSTTSARLVGGSQLFNFGGGLGNPLNVGSRNAITARTLLTRAGISTEKADIGGNKGRNIRFEMAENKIYVSLVGGKEYML